MKILLVIDMLNGFCRSEKNLSLPSSTEGIEYEIKKRILEYNENNDPVFFICDSHKTTDYEINNLYPEHCIAGTEEAQIVDSLKPFVDDDKIILKNTLSITYKTRLIEVIKRLNPSEIEVTGVCTDICVLFATYELKIRGYNVIVNPKCVLPLRKDKQDFFLEYMSEFLGAEIKMVKKPEHYIV